MTLRKATGNEKGYPKKNQPTKKPGITDAAKKSRAASANAKKQGLGGKIQLTDEQKARKATNKKKKQFKPSQEVEIQAFWQSGEFTLAELAERYNRNADSLSRYFSQRGIVKGSRAEEFAAEINKKITEELMGDAGETAKVIKALKKDYLTKFDIAKKLTHNEIASAQRKSMPLSAALPNLRAIKEYIGILMTCRSEEYDLLGVVEFESRIEHDDLPELVISELTVLDIEEMRAKQQEAGSLGDIEISEIEEPEDDNGIVDES